MGKKGSPNDYTSAQRRIVDDTEWEGLGPDLADRLRDEAKAHRATAASFRASGRPFAGPAAVFHERVAHALDEAAERVEKL